MRNKVKKYAPHIYITGDRESKVYDLCVMIPMCEGEIIDLSSGKAPELTNTTGKIEITYTIGGTKNSDLVNYTADHKVVDLKLADLKHNDNEATSIVVKVKKGTNTIEHEFWFSDADKSLFDGTHHTHPNSTQNTKKYAKGCPYLYLEETEPNFHAPYLLLPICGEQLIGEKVIDNLCKEGRVEVYIATVSSDSCAGNVILPSSLETNSCEDGAPFDPMEIYFDVYVLEAEEKSVAQSFIDSGDVYREARTVLRNNGDGGKKVKKSRTRKKIV